MGRTTDCTTWGLCGVGAERGDRDGIFGGRMMLAENAENNQPGGEDRTEHNDLAGLGFEVVQEFAGFHGWPLGERMGCTGALVTVTTGGGGGERRVTSTVKAFFKDSSLRPPSGVPVTAK